jgi:hypothetical protein
MHARVATFDGAEPDQVRETLTEIEQRSRSGPPEGVPAVGFLLLHRAEEGQVVAISLFDTEADLQAGGCDAELDGPAGPARAGPPHVG